MLYEIVPESVARDSACLQAFPARKGAERTRTAVLLQWTERCAVINCRKRKALIRVKGISFGLLVEYLLCEDHEREHDAGLHAAFREQFDGVDFVDPERN